VVIDPLVSIFCLADPALVDEHRLNRRHHLVVPLDVAKRLVLAALEDVEEVSRLDDFCLGLARVDV
jgi:hypothetical protein